MFRLLSVSFLCYEICYDNCFVFYGLFENTFRWELVLYRDQSTGLCCKSVEWFLWGSGFFSEGYFRIDFIYFWTKIFLLVILWILTANFSGLMCQDVSLVIGLQIIFVLIVIQLCHLFSLQVFSNFLMILTSIYRFNKFNSFSHMYRGVSWNVFFFVFPCR